MFNFFKKKQIDADKKQASVTLKIKGMHCASCAMNIDGALEDEVPGVSRAETSYARGELTVSFDPQKVDLKKIQQTISNLGYDSEVSQS